jgi:hypothetical protein
LAAKEIMKSEADPNFYVADVQSHRVLLRSFRKEISEAPPMEARRDSSDPQLWIISAETKQAQISILTALRDSSISMLDLPAGWPPAAVFEQLRDENKVGGKYIAVTFMGADKPVFQSK